MAAGALPDRAEVRISNCRALPPVALVTCTIAACYRSIARKQPTCGLKATAIISARGLHRSSYCQENMRLTVYTDYALRLLIYAALKPDGLVNIGEVAGAYGISRNHLT